MEDKDSSFMELKAFLFAVMLIVLIVAFFGIFCSPMNSLAASALAFVLLKVIQAK